MYNLLMLVHALLWDGIPFKNCQVSHCGYVGTCDTVRLNAWGGTCWLRSDQKTGHCSCPSRPINLLGGGKCWHLGVEISFCTKTIEKYHPCFCCSSTHVVMLQNTIIFAKFKSLNWYWSGHFLKEFFYFNLTN